MVVKESSDELNPPVIAGAEVPSPRRRSARDYVALAIATCGVGYFPLAPGTWGSLLAVGLYLLLRVAVFGGFFNRSDNVDAHGIFVLGELVTIAVVTILGIWAASRTERALQIKDPGKVVIDEVAGQLIALLAVPLVVDHLWFVWVLLAFLVFRFFDIVKPYPARRMESLKGGWGIMADDIVAGVYAAIVVAVMVGVHRFA
jgi:phosphatidylglycerophosphatase A